MDLRSPQRNANCLEPTYNTFDNEIFIQSKRVCVKPLRSRLDAIQKLQPPSTVKGCRSFAGMVNYFKYVLP